MQAVVSRLCRNDLVDIVEFIRLCNWHTIKTEVDQRYIDIIVEWPIDVRTSSNVRVAALLKRVNKKQFSKKTKNIFM